MRTLLLPVLSMLLLVLRGVVLLLKGCAIGRWNVAEELTADCLSSIRRPRGSAGISPPGPHVHQSGVIVSFTANRSFQHGSVFKIKLLT
ncbi:unnamed protein product, partial [Iphiclides podalirius]